MSQAVSRGRPEGNFWWGLGANVESQLAIGGFSAMLAKMNPVDGGVANCVIRVSSRQVGPGLGGGGDVVLVIATGIASPMSFGSAQIDGGWNFSMRDVFSFTSTPKSCFKLAQMVRQIPMSEIVDFTCKHPAYFLHLKDAVVDFYNTAFVAYNVATDHPKLWMFPIGGIGFELGLTYQFGNRAELLVR